MALRLLARKYEFRDEVWHAAPGQYARPAPACSTQLRGAWALIGIRA